VWTTFSRDQVDLNYADPAVLREMVDTLLFYVSKGAEFIRLDAVAYLWKELGTRCIHLPQTHRIVQLVRGVLEAVAPQVSLVTETNVPHEENISYFGNGMNESHLVYNFALPLLVVHAFHAGNAEKLSQWATTLATPSPHATFLNFLASHDGIGINAGRGILAESEINSLVERVLAHGGLVSTKDNPDGSASPYELNINYFDALSNPAGSESDAVRTARFTTAHAIMLAMAGVPAVYFHSIVGSSGWREGADRSGSNRAINRERLELKALEGQLGDPDSRRSTVYRSLMHLLGVRAAQRCFHPQAEQRILRLDESIFALLRTAPGNTERVLCVHNVSGEPRMVRWNAQELFPRNTFEMVDLLAPHLTTAPAGKPLRVEPYQSLWLKPDNPHSQGDRGRAVSSPGERR
jgi:glycosidase